jgi:uncharacterized protein (DUF2252 family)
MDITLAITAFNTGRDPERLAMKYAKLRASPFAFLRGTCHLFYQRMPAERVLVESPKVWVCGDLHLENFGSYKGDNRLAYFDINDFDEAALAPCSWDLVRFLTSVRLGMAEFKLDAAAIAALSQAFLDGYAAELATGKARWVERETSEGLVRELLDTTQSRSRPEFLDTRTQRKGKRRVLRIDGQKTLAVSDAQRQQVTAFMEAFAAGEENPKFFRVLDVARRIAGTGSLGLERYVILVRGRGSPDGNFLLDLKQAAPSALLSTLKVKQPKWKNEAHRVTALQRRVQAVPMAFLRPIRMAERAYILRALQPSEDRIDLRRWNGKPARLQSLMSSMGAVVAWGHLRAGGRDGSAIADELIEFGGIAKWRRQVAQIAEHCVEQVRRDWSSYARAYDEGYFSGA